MEAMQENQGLQGHNDLEISAMIYPDNHYLQIQEEVEDIEKQIGITKDAAELVELHGKIAVLSTEARAILGQLDAKEDC